MKDLGDRMKRYERAAERYFTPRVPVIVRVDGRAFHSFTRGCDRPFDGRIVEATLTAAMHVAEDMQGFTIGYVQSDEASFMLSDLASETTQPWFDYSAAKVVSIAASLMTAHFNRAYGGDRLAIFDARAFSVPLDDAPNCFLWRMRDWQRNSLEMLARAHFSHKQLHCKGSADMREMLHGKGVDWDDLSPQLKNGTVIHRRAVEAPEHRWGYAEWRAAIDLSMALATKEAPDEPERGRAGEKGGAQ